MNIPVPKCRLSALAVVLSSGRFRTNRNIHANLQAVGSLWLFSVEVPERHVDYDAISKEVGVKQIDLCVPQFLPKPVHSHRAVCHERVIRSHTLTRVCVCAWLRIPKFSKDVTAGVPEQSFSSNKGIAHFIFLAVMSRRVRSLGGRRLFHLLRENEPLPR